MNGDVLDFQFRLKIMENKNLLGIATNKKTYF